MVNWNVAGAFQNPNGMTVIVSFMRQEGSFVDFIGVHSDLMVALAAGQI